jgi:hypothetical protein
MGVYVSPTIVRKENGKVTEVKEEGMPQSNPIYALNDLIFLDELKNSLLEIADKDLDLSFFTKPNDYSYGNTANVNTSFSPEEVLKCLKIIRTAFQERENEFVRPISYDGIYNEEGKQIRQAFIEFEEGKLFWKKKIERWGGLNAYENKATFQWYDDENKRWGDSIDLTKEKPVLFELIYEGQKKIKGKKLNYHLKKSRFYDAIEPELNNIETLANYAKEKGYELQIIHG